MPTVPVYDSGDDVGPLSMQPSGTVAMIVLLFVRSEHCFAYRHRACISNLEDNGALISEEADEMEERREDLDEVSETIDSGDDIDDTEVARDDRRSKLKPCGDIVWPGHLSVDWVAQTEEA